MKDLFTRACLFFFLVVLLSGRTNEFGVVVGSATGTVLLWPLYKRIARL
jgi:hypothetical protein